MLSRGWGKMLVKFMEVKMKITKWITKWFAEKLEQKREQDLLRVVLYIDNAMIDYVKQQRFKHLECKGKAWDFRGKRQEISVLINLDYDKKSAKENKIKLNECHYSPPRLCGLQNWFIMQESWLWGIYQRNLRDKNK